MFSTPNCYSHLYVEDNIKNSNNTDTEMTMENYDIIIKAPPPIFIKLIINNYQQFCEEIKSHNTLSIEFSFQNYIKHLKTRLVKFKLIYNGN